MIARLGFCALVLFTTPAFAGVEVIIEGLDGREEKNVEQRLSIKAAAERENLDDVLVQRLHQQADEDIRKALQPYGYYSPQIQSELSGAAPHWKARYNVQPGPVVLITQVDVQLQGEGAGFAAMQEALASLPVRQGERLLHENYENSKTRLAQLAYANGFLDAQFTRAELRVVPSQQSAQVLLTMDTGPRYYFGPVSVEQQGLNAEFVTRYLRIVPGEPFDPQQVLATQFALTDLDYFQTVEIEPRREEMQDRRIPIVIKTTPRLRSRYEVGAGYGTDTGARLTAGAEFRRLNTRGHKVRADMRLSEIKKTFGGEYRIPLGSKSGESVSLNASSISEKFADGDSLKYTVGASLNRTPGRWQRRVYLEFAHEESVLGGQRQISDLLLPGVSFNRGETDDPIHTRSGWNLFLDVHGARKNVLANTSFLQTRAVLRAAYPLGARMRLLGRGEFGASFVDEFSELPASQRFYAGGDQSVRGYGYQSLGPRDANGRVIGGRYLTTLSGEADYRVFENWGVAAFMDAGGADDKPGPDLFRGVGAGLRYRAPIGYLKLDIAHPLDGSSKGVRVHLGVRVGL